MGKEVTGPAEEYAVAPAAKQSEVSFDMIRFAIEKGVTPENLDRILAAIERVQARQAKSAFDAAMAAFKTEIPRVSKGAHVYFTNSRGEVTDYYHADIADVVGLMAPIMGQHGLYHRWQTQQNEKGLITVTCVITHSLGHSESTPLSAMPDTSGGKNPVQSVGSTTTYLERYTLIAALGIAAGGIDDDGRVVAQRPEPEPEGLITEKQLADLNALLDEVKDRVDMPIFLEFCGVDDLAKLPARSYKRVVAALERKRSMS